MHDGIQSPDIDIIIINLYVKFHLNTTCAKEIKGNFGGPTERAPTDRQSNGWTAAKQHEGGNKMFNMLSIVSYQCVNC